VKSISKKILAAALLTVSTATLAQTDAPQQQPSSNSTGQLPPVKAPTAKQLRKASELYLSGVHALEQNDPRKAENDLLRSTTLDPENKTYSAALAVARTHVVTLLVQEADKAKLQGNKSLAREKLTEALARDPQNSIVTQHIYDLAGNQNEKDFDNRAQATIAGPPVVLMPVSGKQSIHLRATSRDLLKRVLSMYGIEATIDESVPSKTTRMDADDVDFAQAEHILTLITKTFFTPLDPKRVIIAADTKDNRQKFQRQVLETVYLPGLTNTEMSDVGNIARQIFEAQQVAVRQANGTLSLRVPAHILNAFNATLADLMDGHSQVVLDVKFIEIAQTKTKNVGVQLPQQFTAFNIPSEVNSLISQNQSLVDQIVSSGLAQAGDFEAIAAILIASGAVSNSILSQPFGVFGGGTTLTGLTLGGTTVNLSLNSSDSRTLDDVRLRVGDQETATFRSGTRYPITTSSYSNLTTTNLTIPGLSNAGLSSSALSGLGLNLAGVNASQTIPQVQYEDLGLTFKATPHILKTGDISIAVDLKIDALAGPSLNDIPILTNRAFTGTVSVPNERSALLVTNLNRQQSRAVSGIPGLGEIPGFSTATSNKQTEQDISKLIILITPHIVRRRTDELKSPIVMLPQH
jgi:general secretion pathway protein D